MDPKWGYFGMVDRLALSDITKHEEIYKQNYKYCLLQLEYWAEKDDYIDKVNKAESQKRKR